MGRVTVDERRRSRVRQILWLSKEATERVVVQARAKLSRYANVRSVSWGLRYHKGRAGGERALIVWVDKKIARDLVPKKQRLPAAFMAKLGKTTKSIPIDVQSIARGTKHVGTAQLRPGRQVTVWVDGEKGSLSACLEPVSKQRAIISGHVAGKSGNEVTAVLSDGTKIAFGKVGRLQNDQTVDAAAIEGVPLTGVDAMTLGPMNIRDFSGDDVGVLVHAVLGSGKVAVAIDAVDAPADFGADGQMNGLLRLDHGVTNPGDSGAPVIDRNNQIVGFVVGYATVEEGDGTARSHTFVLPARRALDVT
jgi:S1-C subfamily serine protease